MKRRSFLAALFAAPSIPALAKLSPENEAAQKARVSKREMYRVDLPAANIGTVTAGVIRTRDGKTVIDLTNGCITFEG